MAYQYENVKLEKGMYGQSGKSFLKVLESLDPSENYKGTALEGLDAFQRQLKRFDIHVKGAGSDMVEKFFHTSESSVLFPEFVSRVVRQGMESDILPNITATVTNFDGLDYRSIASVPTDDDKELKRVEEGASIPTTSIRTQENLVKLHKRGRMLVASYEAIRFQRLDLFSVTLRQIGAYIARMHLKDAIDVLMNGDGNGNGNGQGNGDGNGSGSGNGNGQGNGNGNGNGNGSGSGKGSGRGTGSSSTAHDYVTVPNKVGDDSSLHGDKTGKNNSDYYRAQNGLTWEGDHVSLDSVIADYTKNAYEGISSGRYPSGMENVIKDYFKNLNE